MTENGKIELHQLSTKPPTITDQAIKSYADSIFKTLTDEGCKRSHIIDISSQILGLITESIEEEEQE